MSRNLGTQTRRPADRHLRTAITMLVLAVFVTFAGWYAWNIITQPESATTGSGPTTATTCIPAVPTDAPAPADIRLNVYNATDRNGLASSAAREMRARGFAIVDVANDPLDKTVTGTAEVRAGAGNEAAAAVVVAQVPGAVVVFDARAEGTVDLVVGDAFEALAPAGVAPTPAPSGAPLPAC